MKRAYLVTGVNDETSINPELFELGEIVSRKVFADDIKKAIDAYWVETGISVKNVVSVYQCPAS
jgi:hypothetical protein